MKGQRNPKRLPALLPSGAVLSTLKAAELPGVPRFLMLGAYHAGRVGVYAVPPGTHWTLNAPALPLREAEQLEQRHGAAFLEGTALTLTAAVTLAGLCTAAVFYSRAAAVRATIKRHEMVAAKRHHPAGGRR